MRAYAWAVKNGRYYLKDEEGMPIFFRTRTRAEEALNRMGETEFTVERVLVRVEEL